LSFGSIPRIEIVELGRFQKLEPKPDPTVCLIVDLTQNSSFFDVQALEDKTILFEKNVKQEFNNNNVNFNLLNQDYYNKNNSRSVVKTNNDNNNSERFIILRKIVSRDSNNKKDMLEK